MECNLIKWVYGLCRNPVRWIHRTIQRPLLLTNNPKKAIGLEGYGLKIIAQVPIRETANAHNKKYLRTKREKMGHFI